MKFEFSTPKPPTPKDRQDLGQYLFTVFLFAISVCITVGVATVIYDAFHPEPLSNHGFETPPHE